jgi:hypothetical protein
MLDVVSRNTHKTWVLVGALEGAATSMKIIRSSHCLIIYPNPTHIILLYIISSSSKVTYSCALLLLFPVSKPNCLFNKHLQF